MCSAATLAAHEPEQARHLSLQFDRDAVRLLVVYEERRPSQIAGLLMRYDLNRDGSLDALEGAMAASVQLPVALEGVSFGLTGVGAAIEAPQIKWRREGDALTMAALVSYPWSPATGPMSVGLSAHAQETSVSLRASHGQLRPAAESLSFHLHGGDIKEFEYIAPAKSDRSAKPND